MSTTPIIHRINPVVNRIPRRATICVGTDPAERLIKAVVFQSVADHFFPTKLTKPEERQEALEFLESPDGDFIFRLMLGVPHAA